MKLEPINENHEIKMRKKRKSSLKSPFSDFEPFEWEGDFN